MRRTTEKCIRHVTGIIVTNEFMSYGWGRELCGAADDTIMPHTHKQKNCIN